MLLNINHIRNVGRFYEVVPKGTPQASCTFEQFNLIYADNATGKTTLNTILKSLAYNDPTRILVKKTIPGNGVCEISLKFDDKQCNFLHDAWNKLPDSKFAIFDEEFIEKNIFSPTGIDTNHKRQLFNYVVLGEENVEKARDLQLLVDDQIPAITKEITLLENQLKQTAGVSDIKSLLNANEMSTEDIIKLKSNVISMETQINNSESIRTHKPLNSLPTIIWPEYKSILEKGIDEIGNIEIYKAHIIKHQQWIKNGLNIQKDNVNCPYCFQSITNNEAVIAYKQFFSDRCQELINQVSILATEVNEHLSGDKALLIEQIVNSNKDCYAFWQVMDNDIPPIIPFIEQYATKVKEYRDTLLRLVDHKQRNILQSIELADESNLTIEEELSSEIMKYNESIDVVNKKIAAIQAQHINIDILKEKYTSDSITLKCQQVVFHDKNNNQKSIAHYRNLLQKKQALMERLNALRTEINVTSLKLLDDYQVSINKLLKSFGVEFRINKVERKIDTARKDTLVFAIELKGMNFDPNGSRQIPYSLANTLSSGDKSTLAFALFIAKLQQAELKDTIVIFDDPISSFDFFRRQQTSRQISAISKKSKQVIVFTHSMEFTKLFGHVPVKSKYFKLFKAEPAGVVFTPYDKLSDMCISKHHDEHEILSTYLSSPSTVKRLEVMKAVRSYVETKLCIYIPELSTLRPPTLGNFIEYLRRKNYEESYIDDLEQINDSIVIENHGGDPIADDHSNLTDDELRILCRLALNLLAP